MHPYETVINRQYSGQIEDIVESIEKQEAMGRDRFFTQPLIKVAATQYENDSIGYWAHPLQVGDTTYIDTRPFMNKNGDIKNHLEYSIMLERAAMDVVWREEPSVYEAIMPDLAVIFAEWVSGGIASRYNVGEVDKSRFRVAAAVYYIWLILEQGENNERLKVKKDELVRTTMKIMSRSGGIPATHVQNILSDLDSTEFFNASYPTLKVLGAALADLATFDMGKFDYTTVMQLMGGGSWIGNNNIMLAAMALEYPPLFAVLVKNAYSITNYRNKTRIGRAINAVGRKVDPNVVCKTVENVLEDYKVVNAGSLSRY